jgi:hypothetical protein
MVGANTLLSLPSFLFLFAWHIERKVWQAFAFRTLQQVKFYEKHANSIQKIHLMPSPFTEKIREKYLRKRQTLAQSTSNQNANQQPSTHSSLLYSHFSIANCSSLGLLQIEQGLNLHAPLCFLENQSHDKYGTNLPTN